MTFEENKDDLCIEYFRDCLNELKVLKQESSLFTSDQIEKLIVVNSFQKSHYIQVTRTLIQDFR
jgi:hypothetical protein